jgi:hypothetical protein
MSKSKRDKPLPLEPNFFHRTMRYATAFRAARKRLAEIRKAPTQAIRPQFVGALVLAVMLCGVANAQDVDAPPLPQPTYQQPSGCHGGQMRRGPAMGAPGAGGPGSRIQMGPRGRLRGAQVGQGQQMHYRQGFLGFWKKLDIW